MKIISSSFLFAIYFLIVISFSNSGFAQSSFFEETDIFLKKHVKNGLVDYELVVKSKEQLNLLTDQIEGFDLSGKDDNFKKAFWINTYNLLTIQKIATHYPIESPLKVNSFFENKNLKIAGQKLSLSQLEKEKLFEKHKDSRLHFVLVCAAMDCPKIKKGAFFPEELDEQLDKRCKIVLNDPSFVKIDREQNNIQLSEIFRWYISDFEEGGGPRGFINQYRKVTLPENFKIKYYDYNWTLNDSKNILIKPFRASALLNPGITEIKVFNALYTETKNDGFDRPNSRASYFSSFTQVLYGWKNNINVGFDLVYKSNVTNDFPDASPFRTLAFQKDWTYRTFDCNSNDHNIGPLSDCKIDGMPALFDTLRNAEGQVLQTHQSIGLSHFGPKIKINPIKKWTSLSLQQTLFIPINKSVDGSSVSFTQLFFDKPIGSKSQLFIEASLWTTLQPDFRINPFTKVFYSYFPKNGWTVYGMTSNLLEYGIGTKVFVLPKVEIEFLYTYFLPWETFMQDRRVMTFNIGVRYQG